MQSGDDWVLEAMNRKYSTVDYYNAVESLRQKFPEYGVTTDLIVGFPGETDQMFGNTMAFMEKVQFSDLHVFKYSMRDGTKAAQMSNQVDGSLKQARSQRAMALGRLMHKDFLERFKGQRVEVLFEERLTVDGLEYSVGHGSNHLKVYVEGNDVQVNEVAAVHIQGVFKEGVIGGVKA